MLVVEQDGASDDETAERATYTTCVDRWNITYTRREGLSVGVAAKDDESR